MKVRCLSASFLLSALPALVLLAPAAAQEQSLEPAAEVQKFAPMIGTWEGSGTVNHGADGGSEEWTSKSSARWILGGHFVREDVRIEMKSMPQPLLMTSIYGWDREYGRHVSVGLSNLGEVGLQEVHWTPDGKMVVVSESMMMGTPVVDRWVSEHVGGDKIEFTGDQAQGAGEFHQHVAGQMRRTSKEPSDIAIVDAAFVPEMVGTAKDKLGRLQPALGTYRMKGWFLPAPGAEKIEFTGTEQVRTIYGGSLIEMVSKGDPAAGMPAYEGLGWMGWDDHRGCYVVGYVNNMGEVASVDCSLLDGNLIGTSSTRKQGKPACMRGVTVLGPKGFTEHTGHMMLGAEPPVQVFAATYSKQ